MQVLSIFFIEIYSDWDCVIVMLGVIKTYKNVSFIHLLLIYNVA